MQIDFRPHHFLCALCFQGRGYSPAFIANFSRIMVMLHAEPDQIMLQVVSHTDSICEPCPHRREKSCTSEEKIRVLDQAHGEALALKAGDEFSWNEAKEHIKEHLSLSTFHQICATCEWKALGICEGVLREFLKE